MRQTDRIILASNNDHKLREFQELFSSYPEVKILPAKDFVRNCEKIAFVEEFDSYTENASAKARLINCACHYPSLADDTGLEVKGLDGKPGVRSHRYADLSEQRFSGMNQDEANRELLLSELKARPDVPRSAAFVCVLALSMEGLTVYSKGVLEGTIAESPSGSGGFGYDSLFIPKGSQKTLAEMTSAEKNAISHRARAVHELMAKIRNQHVVLVRP